METLNISEAYPYNGVDIFVIKESDRTPAKDTENSAILYPTQSGVITIIEEGIDQGPKVILIPAHKNPTILSTAESLVEALGVQTEEILIPTSLSLFGKTQREGMTLHNRMTAVRDALNTHLEENPEPLLRSILIEVSPRVFDLAVRSLPSVFIKLDDKE